MICLCKTWRWLYKLEYKYKSVYKDVFIHKYEQPDIFEDCKIFLKKIKELKPCMMEFNKNDAMKSKGYPSNCTIRNNNWWPIILITHYKYTSFINNRIWKIWAQKIIYFYTFKVKKKKSWFLNLFFPISD